jgi:LPS export ABC transporter permease LptF/LPS export ABC transporter permease LptG
MRLLSRTIFREIFVSAMLGVVLFIFVLFLRSSRPLFEFLVKTSGAPSTVAYLFALLLPQALPYTIPLGMLVGTLITLSRMSSDGEITAMRAAGVPGRRVAPPIVGFGILAMCAAAASSLWLTPWSIRESYRIENQLLARQLTSDVQPRVFEEQFPNSILYVNDVTTGPNPQWKRIFLADITPPEQRKPGTAERGDSPMITLASEALAIPDVSAHRIQLALRNGSTYQAGKEAANYVVTAFATGDQWVNAQKPNEVGASHPSREMDTVPLYRQAYRDPTADRAQILDDRIELHLRLALPLACVLLALTGVPLGITARRAGKSAAVVLTLAIALIYYIALISCANLARQGTLPPGIAMWLPNLVFAVAGVVMMQRLEIPGDIDVIGSLMAFFRLLGRAPKHVPRVLDRIGPKAWLARFPLLPQVIDTYVLTSFLFYFVLLLTSFVLVFHVFTFFELLSDIIKHHPTIARVLTYHFFLTPRLIYDFTPLSVLAAVLAAFGVFTKHNETTAFKACGISLYRLAVPILAVSVLLSGSLFAFDHYWVPDADRRQDAIRAEIKGRPPQTYLRPDRKWIYGPGDRIYYYRYFDQAERTMVGVNVYEIDSVHWRLKRHISAERARWEPGLNAWVFQNGWSVEMDPSTPDNRRKNFDNFAGQPRTFPELEETPDYFVREVRQSRQMNFQELEVYIAGLQQSGFDTVALQVQLQKKFSVPLFALIMAMVAIPFAFVAGNRGAMAGVGLSFALAIAYLSVDQIFEQIGNLSQLPAKVAAWSPDVIFSLLGLYFLARMRT